MKTLFGNEMPLPGNTESFNPMDMVMLLGRTHRFGGNASLEWKVLHHSMLVALLWLKSYGSEGVEHALLHDVHEYITGDIPTPVKVAIGRPAIDKVQDELDDRLYAQLGIEPPDAVDEGLITVVDHAALFIEAEYIGAKDHLKHIIDTSIAGWDEGHREAVYDVVRDSFGDVSDKMFREGFFNAPYAKKPPEETPAS